MTDNSPGVTRLIPLLVLALMAAVLRFSLRPEMLEFVLLRAFMLLIASVSALTIIGACVACGLLVVAPWRRCDATWLETLLFSFGCGAGLLSCALLVLGMCGLNSRAGISILIIGIIIAALLAILRWRNAVPHSPDARPAQAPPRNGSSFLFVLMIAWAVLLLLVSAYAPPLLFDVTEYHLGAYADYSRTLPSGKIIPMSHNFYARFPFPIEALYHAGLQLGRPLDFAPKLINASFVAACAALIWSMLVQAQVEMRWCFLGVLLVLAHPVMLDVSLDAFIDAPCAFLIVASVYALMKVLSSADGNAGLMPAAGLLFGTALAAKYTNAQIYLVPVTIACFSPAVGRFLRPLDAQTRRGAPRILLITAFLGSIPLWFWLGKNVAFYGNPLEPFFTWLFKPGDAAAVARESFYISSHYPQSPWSASYWLTLLPRLREFSWMLLALLAGTPLIYRKHQYIGRLLLLIASCYLFWNLVRESQNRFLLPCILLLIYIGMLVMNAIPAGLARGTIAGLLLFGAGVNLLHHTMKLAASGEFSYLGNFELARPAAGEGVTDARDDFYKQNLGSLGEIRAAVDAKLTADAEILMVYEARPYLIPRATVYNTVWDQSELLRIARGATSSLEVEQKLQEAGITHVLVNRQELRRYIQQYVTPEQRRELAIPPDENPAKAFYLAPVPEDLFPPFYRDPDWKKLRQPVLDYLAVARARSIAVAGSTTSTKEFPVPAKAQLEVYVAPVGNITRTPQ